MLVGALRLLALLMICCLSGLVTLVCADTINDFNSPAEQADHENLRIPGVSIRTFHLPSRGVYQTAQTATYADGKLILTSPSSGWLQGMPQETMKQLSQFNINDPEMFATLINGGIKIVQGNVQVTLQSSSEDITDSAHTSPDAIDKTHLVVEDVSYRFGNVEYKLANSPELPAHIPNPVVVIEIWHEIPSDDELAHHKHSLSCQDCNYACHTFRALFGYCRLRLDSAESKTEYSHSGLSPM